MIEPGAQSIEAVAADLYKAILDREAIDPVRDVLLNNLDAAYKAQELLIKKLQKSTNKRIGRKVGLTSIAVQKQLGVSQPDFGVLLEDMRLDEGQDIQLDSLLTPKIEAEIAFVLGSDVNDPERVLESVVSVHPALEIVDSRIKDWQIKIVDTVADNASCGQFLISEKGYSPNEVDLVACSVVLEINGQEASRGTGADCMGDPRNALLWVAETANRLGRPLRAGEIVMSGALGPMVALQPGMTIEAKFDGMQSLKTRTV